MPSSIKITRRLDTELDWEIIVEVIPGGTLPTDIFIYENTGTTELGDYIGVCNLEEYQRLKTFTGTPIPNFGNRFVKTGHAKIKLDINQDPQDVIVHIENTMKALTLAIANASSVTEIKQIN